MEIASALIIVLVAHLGRRYTLNFASFQDNKVVSLRDYTLFFKIDPEQNRVFKNAFYDPSQKDSSRGQQMRAWIWHQLAVFNKDDRIKIARMDLVFDNEKMLGLLKSRGTAIKESNNARVFYLEHLIKEYKYQQYETDVCGVFITFENDSSVQMAKSICEKTRLQIFGKPIKIKRAREPSEYIWDNMGFTAEKQRARFFAVLGALAVTLFAAYKVQYGLQ